MNYLYIIVGTLLLWYVLPYLIKKLDQYLLSLRCRSLRTISLTYDDGPSDVLSRKIFTLLAKHNVKATFFMLGHKLQSATEVADEFDRSGHEIGSHSYSHLNAWKRSPLAVYRDIKHGLAMTKTIGVCTLFRPPHGKATLATMLQVFMNNCTHAWWTIDSSDTWPTPMSIERVVDRIRRDGGGVILMHDHERTNAPEREAYVLALTEKILELARNEGYKVVPMGRLYSG
jgi:peptidoglycan/xylan/chitin deacetylase (PgdA/CDA1 family)